MKIFTHHIYEYKKGLRDLVLHTTDSKYKDIIINKLLKQEIAYVIYEIKGHKINVFFGNDKCVSVIKIINKSILTEYTLEEDFILGALLGYSKIQQCKRYLDRLEKYHENTIKKIS